jgi:hypothetical protein
VASRKLGPDGEKLHILRERHIRCNPTLAQLTVDPQFEPMPCEGPFAKKELDPAYVAEQEAQVTRAWRQLQEIPNLGLPQSRSIHYPK